MMLVLVSAGSETTASLLASAAEKLARDPELQEHLRGNPARIPAAIEDVLRTNGPFQFHYRATPHDTALGRTPIPANSRVLLIWAAANRPSPGGSDDFPDMSEDRGTRSPLRLRQGTSLLHRCSGRPPRGSNRRRAAPRPDRVDRAGSGPTAHSATEHLHPSARKPPHRHHTGLRAD